MQTRWLRSCCSRPGRPRAAGAGPRPMSPVAVAAGTAGPLDPTLRPRSTLAWVLFAFHVLPLVLVMSEVGLLGELKALR